ncbi:hypothetical protein [Saccharopolyspora taberi]|uniref:Uncharacterized protein n=1 Tax=Saccharopolyspora taberi TaxID=60895 RepID=A0ABN3VL30_9PSEU
MSEEEPQGWIPPRNWGSTRNSTSGDLREVVQARDIHGGVTFNAAREPDELLVRRVSEKELDDVRAQFVEPGGFRDASRVLLANRIVVLWGRGSGRSFAALRLLAESGCTAIDELNPLRRPETLRAEELEAGTGYVWDLRDSGDRPFSDSAFDRCVGAVRAVGCRLVVLLGDRSQCGGEGLRLGAELSAPDPMDVAGAVLRVRYPGAGEGVGLTLKRDLAAGLEAGDPPGKAVRAVELAIRVDDGEIDTGVALARLGEVVDVAVDRWFEGRDVLDYAMALTVAVLENSPYDVVVQQALELDEQIRSAQLPEDKPLRPRKIFDKSKEQLLRDTRTTTDDSEHPKHPGLRVETIRFNRQGWASAVLRHAWREYPSAHPVLLEWLRTRVPRTEARRALCSVIADVPAHDPLEFVNELAGSKKPSDRTLAGLTMIGLAEQQHLAPLVDENLLRWARDGNAYQKATAAELYSSPFGLRDVETALEQLGRIGSSDRQTPQEAVIEGALWVLRHREHRDRVIRAVVGWAGPRNRRNGLRVVSMSIALWLAGVMVSEHIDVDEIAESHPGEVRALMRRVMSDPEFGATVLEHLAPLSLRAKWEDDAAAELVRLTELIVPDLRWWARRAQVADLCLKHPDRGNEIRHVFRTAWKCRRRLGQVPA